MTSRDSGEYPVLPPGVTIEEVRDVEEERVVYGVSFDLIGRKLEPLKRSLGEKPGVEEEVSRYLIDGDKIREGEEQVVTSEVVYYKVGDSGRSDVGSYKPEYALVNGVLEMASMEAVSRRLRGGIKTQRFERVFDDLGRAEFEKLKVEGEESRRRQYSWGRDGTLIVVDEYLRDKEGQRSKKSRDRWKKLPDSAVWKHYETVWVVGEEKEVPRVDSLLGPGALMGERSANEHVPVPKFPLFKLPK